VGVCGGGVTTGFCCGVVTGGGATTTDLGGSVCAHAEDTHSPSISQLANNRFTNTSANILPRSGL
jgi:hypothetical protein